MGAARDAGIGASENWSCVVLLFSSVADETGIPTAPCVQPREMHERRQRRISDPENSTQAGRQIDIQTGRQIGEKQRRKSTNRRSSAFLYEDGEGPSNSNSEI